MPSISSALAACLGSVERPGDFCVGGHKWIFMPAIAVDGVGPMAFPLPPALVESLIGVAGAAPHGRGEETVFDRDVRRTWQIEPDRVRIDGRHWRETLTGLVAEAALGLGVSEPVTADFYKLLIYDAGSFFVDHRDTEKVPGMFATLTVVLPSAHDGGNLAVRHLGREIVLDLHPEEPSQIGFAAFYADCVHEVRPVESGYRVALVYSLRFLDEGGPQGPPDYRAERGQVAKLLRTWPVGPGEPEKLILPLEHAYTPAELSFDRLKGADAAVAAVVAGAAEDADCDIHLALVSIEETGSAEYTDSYGHRGRWSRDEEDGDEFEVGEVFDDAMFLSDWRHPDGSDAGFGEIPFDEDEFSPPGVFEDWAPDEQHFYEATGNEGATFERTYRRAGLVLWPRARRLAVLNRAGLAMTLPYLEDLTERWLASDEGVDSPDRREADALCELMVQSWPLGFRRADDDTRIEQMLDLLVRLKNTACIDAVLADLCAEGCYKACDNAAIVWAAACLARPRATELLARILSHNAPSDLPACGALLLRCVDAESGFAESAAPIGAALIDSLPGDPAKPLERDDWQRPQPVTAGFVVDLLTALSRIDARAADAGLAARAVAHIQAWPRTYKADEVLVPAAIVFAERPESSAWPAVRQLREACLDHLGQRIAEPLQPPEDWVRANSLTCDCADCRALGGFLVDPGERQWRLKAPEHRRRHVEGSVRTGRCDLDLQTERRGSPHTLIATKNQASYERRAKQRRRDLAHAAALGA